VPCAWSVSWSVDFNAHKSAIINSGSACKIAEGSKTLYRKKAALKNSTGPIDAYAYSSPNCRANPEEIRYFQRPRTPLPFILKAA
jgi:hypothetical protein